MCYDLRRFPVDVMCVLTNNVLPKIKLAQDNDSELKAIKELLAVSNYEDYCDRNEVLYKFGSDRELLFMAESMQTEIIKTAYEKGHT